MQRCSVCNHTEAVTINERLQNGGSLRSLGLQFHLSRRSLARHRMNHGNGDGQLTPVALEAVPQERPESFRRPQASQDETEEPRVRPSVRPRRKKRRNRGHRPTARPRPPTPAERKEADLGAMSEADFNRAVGACQRGEEPTVTSNRPVGATELEPEYCDFCDAVEKAPAVTELQEEPEPEPSQEFLDPVKREAEAEVDDVDQEEEYRMTPEQAAYGFQRSELEKRWTRAKLAKAQVTLERLRMGNPESGLMADAATKMKFHREVEGLEAGLHHLGRVVEQNFRIASEACMAEGERFFIDAFTALGDELGKVREQIRESMREQRRLERREQIEDRAPKGLAACKTRLRGLRELEEKTIPARSNLLMLCRELARGEGHHRLLSPTQQRTFVSEMATGRISVAEAMAEATA